MFCYQDVLLSTCSAIKILESIRTTLSLKKSYGGDMDTAKLRIKATKFRALFSIFREKVAPVRFETTTSHLHAFKAIVLPSESPKQLNWLDSHHTS